MSKARPMHSMLKPVQLQINNSGAWKTLLRFDAANDDEGDKVQQAGLLLAQVEPTITLRIATVEPVPMSLMWLEAGSWLL